MVSRREVLAFAAAAALAAGSPLAKADSPKGRKKWTTGRGLEASGSVRRYMAAVAALGDGRFLIAGGYNRAWIGGSAPMPLNSAVVYDPRDGSWLAAAPMRSHRARHASVSLPDGRVAMIGGLGASPMASVEIYDPATDTWAHAGSLDQPRYDHVAVFENGRIFVMGGSSATMLSSIEAFEPFAAEALEGKK